MNTDIFKGQWQQLKGEVRRQWGKLTDDDLDQIQGSTEKMVGKLRESYGWAQEDAQREFDTFVARQRASL